MAEERTGKRLHELRVVDLKDELEKRNLETKGVKAQLMDRLSQALTEEGEDPKNFVFPVGMNKGGDATTPAKDADSANPDPSSPHQSFLLKEREGLKDEVKDTSQEPQEPMDVEMSEQPSPQPNGGVEEDAEEGKEETEAEEPVPPEMEEEVEEEEPKLEEDDDAAPVVKEVDDVISLHPPPEDELMETEKTAANTTTTTPVPSETAAEQTTDQADATSGEKAEGGEAAAGEKEKAEGGNSGRHLWVTGLASSTRATDLKAAFSKYGKVTGAKIVTSAKQPGSKCYGFVTMGSAEEAAKCIQHLHRTDLRGRNISVERAKHEHFPSIPKKTAASAAKPSSTTNTTSKSTTATSSSSSKQPQKRQRITPPEGAAGAKKPKTGTGKDGKTTSSTTSTSKSGTGKKDDKKPSGSSSRDKAGDKHRSGSKSGTMKREKDLRRAIGRGRSGPGHIAPPARRTFGSVPAGRLGGRLEERRPPPVGSFRRPSPPRLDYAARVDARHRLEPSISHPADRATSRFGGGVGGRGDFGRSRMDDREELLEQMRIKEAEHRQREEQLRLERERERIKFEREKLEREKLELQQLRLAAQLAQQQGSAQPLPLIQPGSRIQGNTNLSNTSYQSTASRFGNSQQPPSLFSLPGLSQLAGSAALDAVETLRDVRKERERNSRSMFPDSDSPRRGRDRDIRDDRPRGRDREEERRRHGRDESRGERRGGSRDRERDSGSRRESGGGRGPAEVIDYGHGRSGLSGLPSDGVGGGSRYSGGHAGSSPYRGSGTGGRGEERLGSGSDARRGGGRIEERGGWGSSRGGSGGVGSGGVGGAVGGGVLGTGASRGATSWSRDAAAFGGQSGGLSGGVGGGLGGGGSSWNRGGGGGASGGGWGGAPALQPAPASASFGASGVPPVSQPFQPYKFQPGFTRRY